MILGWVIVSIGVVANIVTTVVGLRSLHNRLNHHVKRDELCRR